MPQPAHRVCVLHSESLTKSFFYLFSTMAADHRFVHHKDLTATSNPQAYNQGQHQAELSMERFHYVCAAATQSYSILGSQNRGMLFAREELEFSAYTPYKLKNVRGLKLHVPRDDGTIVPGDIDPYIEHFRKGWKFREAGIMYCVEEERDFWNLIFHFHAYPGSTGIREWDDILNKLKIDGANPGVVPCMVGRPFFMVWLSLMALYAVLRS